MKRKIAIALAALSIILVLTATTNTTMAATYTSIGVSPGSSSIYSETWSASVGTTENKMVITIFSVFAPSITFNVTYYHANGLVSRTQILTIDVSNSLPNQYFSMEGIIATNLTKGDPAYPSAPYVINDSTPMTVAGANRTINHFKQGHYNPATDYWLEDWWDKATGITVKFNLYYPGSPGVWQNITMVSTTAWNPSPPAPAPAPSAFSTTSIIAIAGVGIVALVVGFLVGRRGRRKR